MENCKHNWALLKVAYPNMKDAYVTYFCTKCLEQKYVKYVDGKISE